MQSCSTFSFIATLLTFSFIFLMITFHVLSNFHKLWYREQKHYVFFNLKRHSIALLDNRIILVNKTKQVRCFFAQKEFEIKWKCKKHQNLGIKNLFKESKRIEISLFNCELILFQIQFSFENAKFVKKNFFVIFWFTKFRKSEFVLKHFYVIKLGLFFIELQNKRGRQMKATVETTCRPITIQCSFWRIRFQIIMLAFYCIQ